MFSLTKKIASSTLLSALLLASSAVYAGDFSDSTVGGGGGAQGHRSGSVTVPAGAECLYFGNIVSDGHNPPGTAYIYGPLGYDTIDYTGHSVPADQSMTAIAAGTYNYTLDAYGMVYCGLAIHW